MQLHGRANLTPWTVPQSNDQVTNVYRYYAKLHHALVPFFYSLAEAAHAGGAGIVRPIGDEASWAGDYRFALGDALLVAPVLDATGKRDVALPAGASFYDWWAPLEVAATGGTTLTAYDATDLARIPLFVRAGAIVPMNIEDDGLGLGTAASKNRLTVLVYPDAPSSFDLVDIDEKKTQIDAQSLAAGIDVTLSRTLRETLLRIRADVPPAKVSVDGVDATDVMTRAALDGASSGWFLEQETRSLWVKLPPAPTGHTVHAI
jgi:alpha-D-xyloside xylohydrolase